MKHIIVLGSDHRGLTIKTELNKYLQSLGYETNDVGCNTESSCDYPDYAIEAANMVAEDNNKRGILVCGSGIGMSIAANKVNGIRAALCLNETQGRMASEHNNANILCLSADFTTMEEIKKIVKIWLDTPFAGGRHNRRIEKISQIEKMQGGTK